MMITEHRKSPPAPPYFSSSHGHRKPCAPALRQTSRSTWPCSRQRCLVRRDLALDELAERLAKRLVVRGEQGAIHAGVLSPDGRVPSRRRYCGPRVAERRHVAWTVDEPGVTLAAFVKAQTRRGVVGREAAGRPPARCSSTARASPRSITGSRPASAVELRIDAPRPARPGARGRARLRRRARRGDRQAGGRQQRALRGARDRHRDGPRSAARGGAWASRRPACRSTSCTGSIARPRAC